MENINIEKIMEEIRQDITEKGYTNDMLSFNDVVLDTSDLCVQKFDKVKFNEELYALNHNWEVKAYRAIPGNGSFKSKISGFIKKVIRKCVKFYVEPINTDQNTFNAITVKMFNLVECYISETKKNEELNTTVEKLVAEQEKLKKELEELKKKLQ